MKRFGNTPTMDSYGQYCPVAKAAEVLGDRWTLLILRDMHTGAVRFNDLHRGLPGISRSVLTQRLRKLERDGLVTRMLDGSGRTQRYDLSPAGQDLPMVLTSMTTWVNRWVMEDPTPVEMDPRLLMLWFTRIADLSRLGDQRFVAEFDLAGPQACRSWVVREQRETSLCFDDPLIDIDLVVTADTGLLYQIFMKRVPLRTALADESVGLAGDSTVAAGFVKIVESMALPYLVEM